MHDTPHQQLTQPHEFLLSSSHEDTSQQRSYRHHAKPSPARQHACSPYASCPPSSPVKSMTSQPTGGGKRVFPFFCPLLLSSLSPNTSTTVRQAVCWEEGFAAYWKEGFTGFWALGRGLRSSSPVRSMISGAVRSITVCFTGAFAIAVVLLPVGRGLDMAR